MARWTLVTAVVVATALLVGTGGAAQAADNYPVGSVGIDISYPSCRAKLPTDAAFGVVGVSGGRVFEDNACAAAEAAKFGPNVSFYVNTGLYTSGNYFDAAMTEANCPKGTFTCGTMQYAIDAADHAVTYAKSQGLVGLTPATWWLDVETTNTWDADQSLNTLFITTEHDELLKRLPAGSIVGVYAVPSQWATIVGSTWDPANAYDVWYANGWKNLTTPTAAKYCSAKPAITGGPVVLVQWVASKLDHDYAC